MGGCSLVIGCHIQFSLKKKIHPRCLHYTFNSVLENLKKRSCPNTDRIVMRTKQYLILLSTKIKYKATFSDPSGDWTLGLLFSRWKALLFPSLRSEKEHLPQGTFSKSSFFSYLQCFCKAHTSK